jgi:hypothetical protein
MNLFQNIIIFFHTTVVTIYVGKEKDKDKKLNKSRPPMGPTGVVHQGHVGFNTDQGRFEVITAVFLDQLEISKFNFLLAVARSSRVLPTTVH